MWGVAVLAPQKNDPLNPNMGSKYMNGYVDNIQTATVNNSDFRHVLYTGKNLQLVLMAILPGEDIGVETHQDRDQFFRVESGEGEVIIDGNRSQIKSDDAMIVPAGSCHNVINTGKSALKLYTIYAPPEHVDGTVRVTKAEAYALKEHYDGQTTE